MVSPRTAFWGGEVGQSLLGFWLCGWGRLGSGSDQFDLLFSCHMVSGDYSRVACALWAVSDWLGGPVLLYLPFMRLASRVSSLDQWHHFPPLMMPHPPGMDLLDQ